MPSSLLACRFRIPSLILPLVFSAICAFPAQAGSGPDLAPIAISALVNHGPDGIFQGYSVGATTCNRGDAPVFFCDSDSADCVATEHPILVVNLYRTRFTTFQGEIAFSDFEQIGMSWVRHLTDADNTSQSGCGTCLAPPLGSRQLGVGCSDSLTSAEVSQRPLARRSEVDPTLVSFPFPFTSPVPTTPSEQRLRVERADLDPATNTWSRYFLEVQLLAADDLAAGNDGNNSMYQEVTVDPQTFDLTLVGDPVLGLPAVFAWKDVDSTVLIADLEVPGTNPPQRFFAARQHFIDVDDFDDYTYAIQNINSDLGAQRWSVIFIGGLDFGLPRMNAIPHHSGEPYDTDTWSWDGDLPFFTHMSMFSDTFAMNPNANALRWGTTFSFDFFKDVGPLQWVQEESFELFKPGPVSKIDFTFPQPPPRTIFREGFETGDLSRWSGVVP